MDIKLFLGGRPGKDCGGFCKFCNFKTLDYKKLENITCRYCPPYQKGCNYCNNLKEILNGFKHPKNVIMDLERDLIRMNFFRQLDFKDLKFLVGSMGDITFYPYLQELISELKQYELPIHLGYTSGKGINNENMIEDFLKLNIDEISFSVLSCDPEIRRKWMRDKSPEISLKAIETFSKSIDVHASSVVIPGVTDLEELFLTGSKLEEWGVKSFTLVRFGNFRVQGNILNSRPIVEGIIPHSFEEFQDIVIALNDEFKFRVIGLPIFYPENGNPYIISHRKNSSYLRNLPEITSEATIITGKYSEKYLKKIFDLIDENNLVNVIGLNKEIGDLITIHDFNSINLEEVKDKVVFPGNAMIRNDQAEKLLNKDGRLKRVIRGPDALTPTYEHNAIKKENAIDFELSAFTNLINIINS